MQVIETARIAWKPALVTRRRPRVVRALLRATWILLAVPVAIRAAAAFGHAPALVEAAELAQALYGVAGVCFLAALFFTRGIRRAIAVAVDRRSFFVGTPDKLRRIPRWQVDTATVRPPDRRAIEVRLGTGEIFHVRLDDETDARSLAATLAAAPRRRRSDDD